MTVQPTQGGANAVAAGRLWAGGAATAVVAALIAVVGILLARGVFDVPVLAPKARAPGETRTPRSTRCTALSRRWWRPACCICC